MKERIDKIRTKISDKKQVLKKNSVEKKDSIKSFFSACGIRVVHY